MKVWIVKEFYHHPNGCMIGCYTTFQKAQQATGRYIKSFSKRYRDTIKEKVEIISVNTDEDFWEVY